MTTSGEDGVDDWWREVGTTALLGTTRRPVPPLPALEATGVGVRPGTVPREEALLDAAALGGAMLRAGHRLDPGGVPAQAPVDVTPVAPPRAVQLLELVLTQPPAGAAQRSQLLAHWVLAADAAGRRVPPGLLPRLLDAIGHGRDLGAPVTSVLGERGRWLAARRSEWRWVTSAAGGPVPVAGIASVDEWSRWPASRRVQAVGLFRRRDPAGTRELVASTWATDAARDRHAQLQGLRTGIGPDDEAFLERALDDRAATVRELAAELLDAVPTSARAARMADRLRQLVRRTGLLGRHLEVVLPHDPDPAGVRDGLGTPPPQRSARGWWLERICAGTPLPVWAELTRTDPVTTLRRVSDADVVRGLHRAARAQHDPAWAAALLEHRWDQFLLPVLAPPARERALLARVETITDRTYEFESVLGTLDPPWSPQFSVALVIRLRASKVGSALVAAAMPQLVAGLHPAALEPLEAWVAATGADHVLTTNLRTLLQLHSVQRAITEAFR